MKIAAALFALSLTSLAHAQGPSSPDKPRLTFDVASIHLTKPGTTTGGRMVTSSLYGPALP